MTNHEFLKLMLPSRFSKKKLECIDMYQFNIERSKNYLCVITTKYINSYQMTDMNCCMSNVYQIFYLENLSS